jgi:hypothetical protein
MARALVIHGVSVKERGPWAVFFLSIVTLGIYYLVWYYKVNREIRDFGAAVSRRTMDPRVAERTAVSPGGAVVAITLGAFLIIPPFVSTWRTGRRIRAAQEAVDLPDPMSVGMFFVLYLLALVFLPFEITYAQANLNRLWHHVEGGA